MECRLEYKRSFVFLQHDILEKYDNSVQAVGLMFFLPEPTPAATTQKKQWRQFVEEPKIIFPGNKQQNPRDL